MINLTVTGAAESALAELSQGKQAEYVRVRAVPTCGCGKVGYRMQWETSRADDDASISSGGIVLLIDAASQGHLDGGVLDYKREAMQEGFVITNPNRPAGCGCGSH